MNRRSLIIAVRCGLLAMPIAATSGDDRPLPRPGLWQDTGTATHYDARGRVVTIDGVTVRHTSGRHCMSAREAADFYANPLPTCRFDLRQEGAGVSRATAVCAASGMRFDVVNRVTSGTIDMRSIQTGQDGSRVESASHSIRVGDCATAAASVPADGNTPRPLAPPATWFHAEDYPAAAARAHAGGRVSWEVDVDDSGVVTGCRIAASSGNAGLDAVTCSILRQRGRFMPGRPGTYRDRTSWFAAPR